MRVLAVAGLVVTLVVAALAHTQEEQDMINRLGAQSARLNKLTAGIINLGDVIDKRLKVRADANTESVNMMQRLDRVGDGICSAKNEFNCGNLKCISTMLVCDYEDDCGNGVDENDNICTNPAGKGATFSGTPVFDYCTERKPQSVTIKITEEIRNSLYTPVVNIRARLMMHSKHYGRQMKATLPMEGIYTFGNRILSFNPPEEDKLGIELRFHPGNNDVGTAYVIKELSGEICAEFVVSRD